MFCIFLDPCRKKVCRNYSNCLARSDGTAECNCRSCKDVLRYSPVCGDDGKTHASQCELEMISCNEERNLKIVKKEPCGKIDCTSICLQHVVEINLHHS